MSKRTLHSPLAKKLPEFLEIQQLAKDLKSQAKITSECVIDVDGMPLPIYSFAFGPEDPNLPGFAVIGGVHGVERIGTNLALSFLKTVRELLQWDQSFEILLKKSRLVVLPLLNPAGMYARTRANANGVDLMRNAPIDADERPRLPLVGGHRLSAKLPWFRGHKGQAIEAEAAALLALVKRELFPRPFSISIDLHSGFGMLDRVWFPYAHSRRIIDQLPLVHALKTRLDLSLPNHIYVVEPQSHQYITHGDLWDHLYLAQRQAHPERSFLPLTLEMGSWLWIKKNPKQVFSTLGIFNPIVPHRIQRTLRRHLPLLDFLAKATASYTRWQVIQGTEPMVFSAPKVDKVEAAATSLSS